MEETDTKELLPIYVILEANENTKIKMADYQRAGAVGEPIAEQPRFGGTIMSSGAEVDSQNMFLTQTSIGDYEELCRMDVLGLQGTPIGDQDVVHQEFLEPLKCRPEGWYETALPWKGGHPPLPNNNTGSLKRLASLVRRLKRNGKLEDYDAIIQQQLEEGVAEEGEEPAQAKEFYIPHKAVIRDSSETTKMRIVYDASARVYDAAPFVNECLESGPPAAKSVMESASTRTFQCSGYRRRHSKGVPTSAYPRRRSRCAAFSLDHLRVSRASTYTAIHTSSVWLGPITFSPRRRHSASPQHLST